MYDLVLLRHGHALSTGEAGVSFDAERPLSGRGIAEAGEAAQRLKAAGFRPGLIVASPFRRAVMTAEIADGVFPGARRVTTAALSDGDAAGVVQLLSCADLREGAGVLVVGHQPLLGFLAGFFLAREAFALSPAGFVRIKTGDAGFTGKAGSALVEQYAPAGNLF